MKPNRTLLFIFAFALFLIGCRTVNLQEEQPFGLEPETQSIDILQAPLAQPDQGQPQQAQETIQEQPSEQQQVQEQPAQEQAPAPTQVPQPAQEQPAQEQPPAPVTERRSHIVQSGDVPGSIAEAYGVPLDLFLQVNGLGIYDIIYVEDSVIIPSSQEVADWQNANPGYIAPDPNANTGQVIDNTTGYDPNNYFIYTVSYGETLGSIALAYGFGIDELAAYNGIANVNDIDINQQIRIPNR